MSWSVIITDRFQDGPDTVVRTVFTDNVSQKFVKEYRLSSWDLSSFKSVIQNQIDTFSNQSNVLADLPLGPFDPTIATTPVDPAQTQFSADLQLLERMVRAINLGIKTSADTDYLAQLSKVQKALGSNPSFVGLV